MLNQSKVCKFGHDTVSNKILNQNAMFLTPVTENEALNVTSKLKGKFSADYDETPERLVKESIQFIKKPLTFILNT
jgi:predicted molibdopterin-dependent oxidoreductase YjgC